jgi:hypothetical protein
VRIISSTFQNNLNLINITFKIKLIIQNKPLIIFQYFIKLLLTLLLFKQSKLKFKLFKLIKYNSLFIYKININTFYFNLKYKKKKFFIILLYKFNYILEE